MGDNPHCHPTASDVARRFRLRTPPDTYPAEFARGDEAASEIDFILACDDSGVDPGEVLQLVQPYVAKGGVNLRPIGQRPAPPPAPPRPPASRYTPRP